MSLKKFRDKFPIQVDSLVRAKMSGRMAHSFLISSDSPMLKDKFATALSKLIACNTPTEEGYNCGECKVCRQIQDETYPELHTLRPLSKSRKIEVGKDINDIGTIRWFEDIFYFTTTGMADVKIGIIYDAECMTSFAQNAFLKTLEEPPPKTFFILTTTKQALLLPTIRSRCQRICLFDNKCVYTFPYKQEISKILYKLVFETHGKISKAELCASELIELINRIQTEIEKKAKETTIYTLDEDMPDSLKKAKQQQFDAAVKSEYLKVREEILSYIHTWFAHFYMLAVGVNTTLLHEFDINEHYTSTSNKNKNLDPDIFHKYLSTAETLIKNLRWNIKDELAFRDFCYNIS